jgi:uncharacterized protein YjiS (DUF1127 family)
MHAIIDRQMSDDLRVWHPFRLVVRRIANAVAAWQEKRRQGLALGRLDERLLADIGLARKPQFWESALWTRLL